MGLDDFDREIRVQANTQWPKQYICKPGKVRVCKGASRILFTTIKTRIGFS